jgi:hypothetical protein
VQGQCGSGKHRQQDSNGGSTLLTAQRVRVSGLRL